MWLPIQNLDFMDNTFLDLICSLELENFRKKPVFSSFLSNIVVAKSYLDDIISLPVTMVTEMRYPGVCPKIIL